MDRGKMAKRIDLAREKLAAPAARIIFADGSERPVALTAAKLSAVFDSADCWGRALMYGSTPPKTEHDSILRDLLKCDEVIEQDGALLDLSRALLLSAVAYRAAKGGASALVC